MNTSSPILHPKKLFIETQNESDINIWYCGFPEDEVTQKLVVAEYRQLLPENLLQAHWGRKTEYIAGRLAAKAALAESGMPDYLVVSHEDRSPIWPQGYRGSLTHKKHLALAAVYQTSDSPGDVFLGVDLEVPMTEKAANKLARKIIDDTEKQLLMDSAIAFEAGFTRTFSAKEALYKAVYPDIQRYLPFSVCQLTHIEEDRLTLQLQPELADELEYHTPFVVQNVRLQGYILSILRANR